MPRALAPLTSRLLGGAGLEKRLGLLDAVGEWPAWHEHARGVLEKSPDWPRLRSLLERIVAEKLPVLVYGDYDVDGTFASFMLFRYLRSQGVPGNIFLPSRFRHGYGLDAGIIASAPGQGYKVLLALDCGTANHAEIAQATAAGLEAAIIDHHTAKDELPAVPVLNPHLAPGMPPFCAAGLVYFAISALNGGIRAGLAGDETELAGLATIADVVPLIPDNWVMAHQSLLLIPESANLGLAELTKASGLHGLTRLTAQQAAFQLVPRLNSAGRMRSPRLVLDLLGARDVQEARRAAAQLEQLNSARKSEAEQVFRKALLQVAMQGEQPAYALVDENWHIGVIGIVAAKVAEQAGRPVALFTADPRGGGLLSGSVRSGGFVDVIEALTQAGSELQSFGGHRDAAGAKLDPARLEQFREAWAAAVKAMTAREQPVSEEYESFTLADLTSGFEADLWALAPFGAKYPAPRAVLEGLSVQRVSYMGGEKTHLSIVAGDGERQVRIAAFNKSHLFDRLRPGTPLRALVDIDTDNWNNELTISLRLVELADEDAQEGRTG